MAKQRGNLLGTALRGLILGLLLFAALLPFLMPVPWDALRIVSLIGWLFVAIFLYLRWDLQRMVLRMQAAFSAAPWGSSLERRFRVMIDDLQRKNRALSLNLMSDRISDRQELSQSLERIVSGAMQLLRGVSGELALFDMKSGLYHSSLVLGRPVQRGSQAMLAGAVEGDEVEAGPDVLVQPIIFAGSQLGSLRITLAQGRSPAPVDREIIRILGLQAGLAILNAEYSAELIKMQRSAEESTRAKTGFLASLSHELRGPLGLMLNAVEVVADGLCGPVNSDQLECLRMVKSSGQHLLELVNDVLDYAKIEAGKLTVKPEAILLAELLPDLCNVVRKQAEAKEHQLECKASADLPAVLCDRRHLRQMLINLLSNAVKYTLAGGRIEIWAEAQVGGRVKINVRDTGVGIAAADRAVVFSAFERVDDEYSSQQQGTGLGMTLTSKLAALNGGTVDFDSASGQGSHFWLLLPAAAGESGEKQSDREELPEADGGGALIVLLEVANDERGILERYLKHLNFAVSTWEQTEILAELVARQPVDLLIMGDTLLEAAGLDLIRQVRAASSSRLPVVLLSGHAFNFDIERYLRAGVDRCLTKPLELKELGRICRSLIDG